MGVIVQKYGGSSVATPERIKFVASRIQKRVEAGESLVVVVSAMGKSTDQLIQLAKEIDVTPSEREMDMLLATGEQVSIAMLAIALNKLGVPAVSLTGWQAGILTEAAHGSARILEIDSKPIEGYLAAGNVVIVAGFQGISENGGITTLGRGGSDTTAVALAATLQADRCEIYTDVDGIYTTDPRVVPNARKLTHISYDEMLELANLGAGVLHPRSVECGKMFGVPILVGSSFVEEEGTLVTEGNHMIIESDRFVTGIAADDEVARITVEGLPNVVTTLSTLFNLLAQSYINVDIIITNLIDENRSTVSFTISESDLTKTITVLENHKQSLNFKTLHFEQGLAKVSIVGSGMISHYGVAAQMFELMSTEGIEVKMVSTSEIKISTVIDGKHVDTAVQKLHAGFHLE